MGEISRSMAYSYLSTEISTVQNMKKQIRENFEEMDFTNADRRNEMETIIVEMEGYCDELINSLNTMEFQ